MPQLAAGAIAKAFLIGKLSLAASLAIHAASAVVLMAFQRKQLSRDTGRILVPRRDIMIRATTEHRRIVYGECAVSGTIFFVNSQQTFPGEYDLYFAIAHCAHEVDSYQGWYIDEKYIPAADVDMFPGDDGAVSADTEEHALGPVAGDPILWLRGHDGADDQTADSFLTAAFPTTWGADHRARGHAYTVARLRRMDGAEDRWETFPQTITAVIRGKKVYDPRLDDTRSEVPGAAGDHRVDDPDTWEFSSNPVLCIRDYLCDAKVGAGKHWDHTRFDYTHIAEQADICDDLVEIPDLDDGGFPGPPLPTTDQARYSLNGMLSCGATHEENLLAMFATMNGRPAFKNGKMYLYAGAYEAPTVTLNENHLAGDIEYRKQPDSDDRYNQVRGTFYDSRRDHKDVEFLPVNDPGTRADRDNDRELPRDVVLALVNNEFQAQRLAFGLLYQCEDTGVCNYPVNAVGLQFEAGDPVAIDNERLGWSEKPFRVVGFKHAPYDRVELVLREYNESSFDDPAAEDYGLRTEAGILSFPRNRTQDPPGGGALIPDPFFSRSVELWDNAGGADGEHLKYFWRDNQSTPGSTTVQILRTGGLEGGVLEINFAAGSGFVLITSIPRKFSRIAGAEDLRLAVRIRKRDNPTLTTGAITFRVGVGEEFGDLETTAFFTGIDFVDINGWTVDEWQSINDVGTTNDWDEYPYVYAEIESTATMSHDITIEIDTFFVGRD